MTPRYTVINCLGRERKAARLKTQMFIPKKTRHVTTDPTWKRESMLTTSTENSGCEMTRNGAQARNEGNLEPTIPYYFCKAPIRDFGPLHLFTAGSTTVFESTFEELDKHDR